MPLRERCWGRVEYEKSRRGGGLEWLNESVKKENGSVREKSPFAPPSASHEKQ